MKTWQLLPEISASMPFQMALDELCFRRAKNGSLTESAPPIIRFYFSSGPWITVGYSQTAGEINSVPVCKRLTGGGRVRHGSDLIFSLIARKSDHESFTSVRISYLKIHEAVKSAFEALGRSPRMYRCDEELPRGEDCFRFPIATDLSLNGRKVAGGSQKRSSGFLLHQESIQDLHGIPYRDLIRELSRAFEQVFAARLVSTDLSPELLREAEESAGAREGVAV